MRMFHFYIIISCQNSLTYEKIGDIIWYWLTPVFESCYTCIMWDIYNSFTLIYNKCVYVITHLNRNGQKQCREAKIINAMLYYKFVEIGMKMRCDLRWLLSCIEWLKKRKKEEGIIGGRHVESGWRTCGETGRGGNRWLSTLPAWTKEREREWVGLENWRSIILMCGSFFTSHKFITTPYVSFLPFSPSFFFFSFMWIFHTYLIISYKYI